MLRQIFKTYGRYRREELAAALRAIAPSELIAALVQLFVSGELQFRTTRRAKSGHEICRKFYQYHKANHWVADWFLKAAQELKHDEKRERYGVAAITERIRWHVKEGIIKTDDGFRVSNDLRACYARLVLMRDPSLCGLFALRPSVVDEVLVVDGRAWSAFAQEHHAALWPESPVTSDDAQRKDMGKAELPSVEKIQA